MLRLFFTFAFVGVIATPLLAQDKYEIKFRKDTKGDVTKVTETVIDKGVMKISVMGQTMPKDEDRTLTATYTEKVIEKQAAKKPTKVERTYTKAELIKDGDKMTPSFIGKTLLIERSGDGFKLTIDGKELDAADAAFFKDEFSPEKKNDDDNFEEFVFPKKAVAVNETWKPDVEAIVKELNRNGKNAMSVDTAKAKAEGKLTKAYKKDGKQYGVGEVVITLPLKEVGEGDQKITLEDGSVMKLTFRFDGAIDGSNGSGKLEMSMDMKFTGSLKTPDGIEVKLEGTNTRNANKSGEPVK